ncbi:hypothetical protein HMPREF9087_0711 [Enterococcus casseliflavus ATCC 12755]|uniref:Uncharacterized protein n=2 Tax=Enterococcus casseliflavus TaxID=37734 RepID=A0A415EMW7_ENTCA|nr:hypothetical protein HMPREF9087_0711 [Enterococcus casseliflavus ATCC 12755]RHK03687.1 hypothetical protein DW084_16950 [Enterococcus casseliflavus]
MKMLMKTLLQRGINYSLKRSSAIKFFEGIIAFVVLLGTIFVDRWSGHQNNFSIKQWIEF